MKATPPGSAHEDEDAEGEEDEEDMDLSESQDGSRILEPSVLQENPEKEAPRVDMSTLAGQAVRAMVSYLSDSIENPS
jgi:hypothetical protein